MISLEQARQMIAVARATGRDLGLKPLSVAVLDAAGICWPLSAKTGQARAVSRSRAPRLTAR